MFNGFTDKTFEFYMAIRFNNNREFFQSNHDWYVESVRTPLIDLCRDLSETMNGIDPMMETRPEKCVCRINRDIRFSKDKAPYRDNSFFSFHRRTTDSSPTLGFYFDVSDQSARYGMGYYDKNLPMMNALRNLINSDPDRVLSLVRPAMEKFNLVGNVIKRMTVPDDIPQELKPWYPLRGFYFEHVFDDFGLLRSPALVDVLKEGYLAASGLYKALMALEQ